jgi:hypothetical protein
MGTRLVLMLGFLLLIAPVAPAQFQGQSAKFRDPVKEDEVARTFENARKQAGAKRLARIKFREEVQELVCTAALNDRVPMYSTRIPALGSDAKWHPASVLYKTTEPAKATDEIYRLASLDPLHKQGYKRFSVAVWRSALSTEERQYWVGIQFYWSAGVEFFDYHFTDDIWYHNAWKRTAAPECRSR